MNVCIFYYDGFLGYKVKYISYWLILSFLKSICFKNPCKRLLLGNATAIFDIANSSQTLFKRDVATPFPLNSLLIHKKLSFPLELMQREPINSSP